MEQEAFRRAQEMHSYIPRPQKEQKSETPAPRLQNEPLPSIVKEEKNALSTLFPDKEKLLILALILVLSAEEKTDPSLTLALLYLII